jgi:hypothetical protein
MDQNSMLVFENEDSFTRLLKSSIATKQGISIGPIIWFRTLGYRNCTVMDCPNEVENSIMAHKMYNPLTCTN